MTQWDKLSGNIWETYGFDPHNKNTWSYAINHGAGNIGDDIDFSEFEVYSAQIEAAVRDQVKDNITMEQNEAGVPEYKPEEMEKDKIDLEM